MIGIGQRLQMRDVVCTPIRSWRDRVFAAVAFFSVAGFVAFVLTLIVTDIFYINAKAVFGLCL